MTRRTIARAVSVEGAGLHLGKTCKLHFKPAESGTGIVFVRTDRPGSPEIKALASEVTASDRRTQIGGSGNAIHTVEHVLSAVAGLNIDDLRIEMNGPEPPILDGSAIQFVRALRDAGEKDQKGDPRFLVIREKLRVIDGPSIYEVFPSDRLQLDVTIHFDHPKIGTQTGTFVVSEESFVTDLAPARTFGFVREVEELRSKGLIQGASLDNAIVLDDSDIVSGPLRWEDEFVRHKALDCIGDLALAGARVRARIVAQRPSHRGTVTLVREMLKSVSKKQKGESRMEMQIDEIMKVLPHRYPFLLVDRILEIEANKRIVGLKNVTINEPFFEGHFPGHPIMPGVLIIEAMAQVGGMLLMGSVTDPENKVVYFMSLDNVKFRRPVKPGDQIRFELEIVQIRGTVCKMRGVGKVEGEVVAEADMAAMVRPR